MADPSLSRGWNRALLRSLWAQILLCFCDPKNLRTMHPLYLLCFYFITLSLLLQPTLLRDRWWKRCWMYFLTDVQGVAERKKSLSVILKARCNRSTRYLNPKLCSYRCVAASLLEPQAPSGMELKEYFLALYISELCCCKGWWIAFIVDPPSLPRLPPLSQHSHLDINLAFPCSLPPLSSYSPPAAPPALPLPLTLCGKLESR